MYEKIVTKVNAFDACGIVLKVQYDTDKSALEKKINETEKKVPDVSVFVRKTDNNTNISEAEGKIPSAFCLATTAALTAVENKISNVSNLVKKTDYEAKIAETGK